MNTTGYYYLHATGDLIWKKYEPEQEPGGFVRKVWDMDRAGSSRDEFISFLCEARDLGANPQRIAELAQVNHIDPPELNHRVEDIGETVLCDWCDADYTGSDAIGGFLYGGKAVCPACSAELEASAKRYHEEHFIRARAKPGETFAAFCLRLRGGDNRIIERPL